MSDAPKEKCFVQSPEQNRQQRLILEKFLFTLCSERERNEEVNKLSMFFESSAAI